MPGTFKLNGILLPLIISRIERASCAASALRLPVAESQTARKCVPCGQRSMTASSPEGNSPQGLFTARMIPDESRMAICVGRASTVARAKRSEWARFSASVSQPPAKGDGRAISPISSSISMNARPPRVPETINSIW